MDNSELVHAIAPHRKHRRRSAALALAGRVDRCPAGTGVVRVSRPFRGASVYRLLRRDASHVSCAGTMVAVVALAVSIGAMTTMFSAVDAVLLRPLPYPEADRVVVLMQRFEVDGSVRPTSVSALEFADYRSPIRTLQELAAWAPADVSLTGMGLEVEPRPEIHIPACQSAAGSMAIVLRAERDSRQLTTTVQRLVRGQDRELPIFNVRPMDRLLSDSVETQRFHTIVIGVFAAVVLILAVTGLYGVMAHWVSQRTQELGIRMALAASGVAAGAAGGWVLTRLIRRLLYAVKPGEPATFGLIALLLLVVAIAASYIPARRAASVDPLAAIRHE